LSRNKDGFYCKSKFLLQTGPEQPGSTTKAWDNMEQGSLDRQSCIDNLIFGIGNREVEIRIFTSHDCHLEDINACIQEQETKIAFHPGSERTGARFIIESPVRYKYRGNRKLEKQQIPVRPIFKKELDLWLAELGFKKVPWPGRRKKCQPTGQTLEQVDRSFPAQAGLPIIGPKPGGVLVRLQGKVAIVTGASKGIGEAVSMSLAAEGADLVLASRSITEDDPIVENIEKMGRRVMVRQVDVGNSSQVFAMVDSALEEFGHIDVLFNNAGIFKPAMLWKMTLEQWEEVLRVNLSGTFYCLHAVAKPMIEQKKGSIINVTSSAGLMGTIGQINYTAAKGGVYAMAKSAAKELARYNIRVNTIAPMAETDMTRVIASDPKFKEKYLERIPLGRFGRPDEIGPAVVFLASDESSYITGQTLCIDGGMVML